MSRVPIPFTPAADIARAVSPARLPSSSREFSADAVLATHARTSFNFAARFLPPDHRRAATDTYAFFRTLDDLVDESPVENADSVRDELAAWRSWLAGDLTDPGPREPLAGNLAAVVARYSIPVEVFQHLIDGLESDLEPREIADEIELERYCYQVASTVGRAMAHILCTTSPHALAAAEELGAAMQLTNILRDVGEDLNAGRVYLPRTLLAGYGLCRDDLVRMQRARQVDDRYRSLMRAQIARAHQRYVHGTTGIWLLPAECRLPIMLATRLYRRLLGIIERNDYDTINRRVRTSKLDKLQEAAICWTLVSLWRHGEHPDPIPRPVTPDAAQASPDRHLEAPAD